MKRGLMKTRKSLPEKDGPSLTTEYRASLYGAVDGELQDAADRRAGNEYNPRTFTMSRFCSSFMSPRQSLLLVSSIVVLFGCMAPKPETGSANNTVDSDRLIIHSVRPPPSLLSDVASVAESTSITQLERYARITIASRGHSTGESHGKKYDVEGYAVSTTAPEFAPGSLSIIRDATQDGLKSFNFTARLASTYPCISPSEVGEHFGAGSTFLIYDSPGYSSRFPVPGHDGRFIVFAFQPHGKIYCVDQIAVVTQ